MPFQLITRCNEIAHSGYPAVKGRFLVNDPKSNMAVSPKKQTITRTHYASHKHIVVC